MLNKMCNTYLLVLVTSLLACILIASCESSYLDDESLADAGVGERSAMSDKYTALWNWLQEQRQERQLQREGDLSDNRLSLLASLRKRGVDYRSPRSGGMALCLWKICPAAPWLINK